MKILISIYIAFGFMLTLNSQSVAVVMERTEINIEDEKVCFELKIINLSNQNIVLAGQNYRLLYNSSEILIDLANTMSLLPTPTYTDLTIVSTVENVDASHIMGPLAFESTMGFFNFFIDLNDFLNGGITIPAGGEVSVAKICFDIISLDDIICLDIIITEDGETNLYLPVFTSISLWENSSQQITADVDSVFSINEENQNSCFTISESSVNLCTDGIDNDEDGLIDCLDPDCNDINVLCEDQFCGDGIDNDRDGLIDCDDPDCLSPTLDSVLVVNPMDCNDIFGGLEILPENDTFLYSINGGVNFSMNNIFSNLDPGDYNISVQHAVSGCILDYDSNPTTIDTLGCEHLNCSDGLDNDGDGLIDCEDDDCLSPVITNVVVNIPLDCENQIASIEVLPSDSDYLFSIDSVTFETNNMFNNLVPGTYNVTVQHSISGCIVGYENNPIIIDSLVCEQGNCGDGIDNDGDGLIDCEDDDCLSPMIDDINVTHPIDCDTQLGTIEVLPSMSNFVYSIDGIDYVSNNVFENISPGMYDISVQHVLSGCIVQLNNSVSIDSLFCETGNCNDGIDNDGDGLIDCEDDDCGSPIISSVNVGLPTNCQNQVGSLEILPANDGYMYSIDGINFSTENIFLNIPSGDYNISVQNETSGCIFTYGSNPVVIDTIDCETDCGDGIDNDQDGMIDCEDSDCNLEFQCSREIETSNILNRHSSNNFLAISLGGGFDGIFANIEIYDRWGNIMYQAIKLEPSNRLIRIDIDNIEDWSSGVYVIYLVINEDTNAVPTKIARTLTIL